MELLAFIGPCLAAFFGSVLYNWFLFTRQKNKFDLENNDPSKSFDLHKFWKDNWDDIGFTMLCTPVVAFYKCDIVAIIQHWFYEDLPDLGIYYLGVGILVQVIYWGFDKLLNLITTLKPKAQQR